MHGEDFGLSVGAPGGRGGDVLDVRGIVDIVVWCVVVCPLDEVGKGDT